MRAWIVIACLVAGALLAGLQVVRANYPNAMDVNIVAFGSNPPADPCVSPAALKSSVAINITTATTTQLVAVVAGKSIYVCGIALTISEVVTTPNTILFEYGTSTTCTGTHALSGIMGDGGVTAGTPTVITMAGQGTLMTAIASNGLCVVTAIGATGSFQGFITYVQV